MASEAASLSRRRVAVLGAGAWGTALAAMAADGPHAVSLWEPRADAAAALSRTRTLAALPGFTLRHDVQVGHDLSAAVSGARLVVMATPSEFVRATAERLAPLLDPRAIVVCAAKGLEEGSHATLDRVIAEATASSRVALLSGPTFARELAIGLPAAAAVASRDAAVACEVQQQLGSERFRLYTTDDVTGVAVGGALKNVVAIAVGFSDGLGFGANARAALITRGLSEIGRLAVKLGAHPLTLSGLAGLGDLVLTCTGDLSRNRQVGLALAKGDPLASIKERLGQVAEGIGTSKVAAELAEKVGVEMPITQQVASVLHGGQPPAVAVAALLAREFKPERG